MKKQAGLLVAAFLQSALGVVHEQGVTVVDGVTQLECKDGVGADLPEAGAELVGGEAVLVQAVVPTDALQDLQVATDQPITTLHHHLYKC